jgi:hypothetical protein
MLNVWIGNLGKYNEGELIGEWLELPVSKKELNTFLKEKVGLQLTQAEVEKALAKDGVCYEEYMINDYETDLPIRVSEYSNLMMLNLLAMSSERVNNMEAVEAYIEYQGIDDIEEIINVMLQEDEIPFYPYEPTYENLSNGEKYGISKAIWSGLDEILEKYYVTDCFDYEKYGMDDDVNLYENGYLENGACGDIDLHYYSLKEIKEELGYDEEVEDKKLRIIYKEVGKNPVVMEIDDTLEAKQKLVGGLIEVVPYKEDLLLVCNEEGKILNQKPNLDFGYDYIAGNCFVVGDDFENAGFKSVSEEKIEEIKQDLKDRSIEVVEIEEVEEDDMEF